MNTETLNALNESIAHWERMRDGDPTFLVEVPYSSDCPLCELFEIPGEGEGTTLCEGCPVRKRAGFQCCQGTPWLRAAKAFDDARHQPEDSEEMEQWRTAAEAMITFLRSLLPETKKANE